MVENVVVKQHIKGVAIKQPLKGMVIKPYIKREKCEDTLYLVFLKKIIYNLL